ncbi:MAG: nitrogen fixation protein FixH [Proteobacteria bacterium]|uniref:nitrogen fixation protein FixH n=1 Tax=Aquabacterium sp. TaxID=1872578 RepID=UPI0035C6EB9E|nr:nitrogen fixation protein FixH [Pseudomonadota bacterium]
MSEVSVPAQGGQSAPVNTPWWRLPIVWMVIGGPAIVVVASIVTAGIAIKHVDPVLDTSKGQVKAVNDMPAMKVRNHAANADAQAPADK